MVFASGKLKIADMAKPGFLANWIGIICLTLYMYSLGLVVFGINFHELPSWAVPSNSTMTYSSF